MKSASNRMKWTLALGIVCGALLTAKGANAAECMNDIDCKGGGAACGGDVCSWPNQKCQAAGTATGSNTEGWCMVDSDCKCASAGATCVNFICTFTKPKGAAGSGGSSGQTGGTSGGSGGASAGSGGSGGPSAGSGGASASTDAGTTPAKDSGGCSVAGSASSSGLGLLLALGAVIGFRRRNRR